MSSLEDFETKLNLVSVRTIYMDGFILYYIMYWIGWSDRVET